MRNNEFDPVGLHVDPGTTVRFEIEAGSHSATAYKDRIPEEATAFDSGVISSGEFEHTFEIPGTYDFYCTPHQSVEMVGRIVVGEPGGPAEIGSIPDGSVPVSETIIEQGRVSVVEFSGSGGNDNGGGGMMNSGSGMMGGDPGWMIFMPIGFLTVFLGLVGSVVYGATRLGAARPNSTPNESAMRILKDRYARGEIDEEEFVARKRQLQGEK